MSTTYDEFSENENVRLQKKTLGRILGLLKPHWKTVALFLVTISIVSSLDSILTYLSKGIIDNGILAGDRQSLTNTLVTYGGLILLQSVLVFGFIFSVGLLGERVRYDLRKKLFNHLQRLSLSFFSKTPVGWIIARVTSDTERLAEVMTWGLLDITWAIVNVLTASYFMVRINWQLALIVIAALPVMIIIAINFRKKIFVHYRRSRKMNSKIVGSMNENITGVRVVKALSREKKNLEEFSVLTDDMYKASYRAAFLSALFLPTVQIISAIALGSILWLSQGQVKLGLMTIGGIQAFVSYITFIMWPIQDMARVYAEMQNAFASAERIFTLMDTEPKVKDRAKIVDVESIAGDIVFDHVSFSYEENDLVIDDLSFTAQFGQMIALVGPTGGGKSTIVNLLCRFYEPTKGTITINGIDYHNIRLHDIQSRIGMVLQTPHLFSGTIMENIRYGNLKATDEEIITASKQAGAHEFITGFEKGYLQDVGEGGNLLSVGQKQLISIARAILAKPEIFIMDEATSSVDTLTEALIQKGMDTLMKNRTSFIIAHRLSTIKRADKIIVISDGKIAEMGTHQQLIKRRGHYYNLYTRQFRQELETQLEPLYGNEALPGEEATQ